MAKQQIEMDNGEFVELGSKEITGVEPVLVTGWNPGQAPHFSMSTGLISELMVSGKLEKAGEYNGIPVVRAEDLIGLVKSAVEETHGVTWKTAKTNSGVKATKELNEQLIQMVMNLNGFETKEEAIKAVKEMAKKEQLAETETETETETEKEE